MGRESGGEGRHARVWLSPSAVRLEPAQRCPRLHVRTKSPSLVAQLVKNPPASRKTWVPSLGWEDPLEKGKAAHSSILAWRVPWTVWGGKESDTTEQLSLSI